MVRWRAAGQTHQRTFASRKLADSFRSDLMVAVRQGTRFDPASGLPEIPGREPDQTTWYDHACAFMDVKWDDASPRHRKSLAEAMTTLTAALVRADERRASPARLRAALMGWSFNTAARSGIAAGQADPPDDWLPPLQWVARRSVPLTHLGNPTVVRQGLEAIGRTLEGKRAAAATVRRKRSAFYSALAYAVERGMLPDNPLDKLRWSPPAHTDVVDRRVVANPQQARALLAAVTRIRPSMEAFFACIYYAAMRPAEVRHLRVQDCNLPPQGWGTLLLTGSTQEAGRAWTDSGAHNEDRSLKHRAQRQVRPVPASPELVDALHRHIENYPPGVGGRLFVTRTGRAGVPLAPPYAKPVSMSTVYRTWSAARQAALTATEAASPLARRPYDLRHAAVSLWLNAGVPATQVAEWAGHSVNVLLRVYAACVSGQEQMAMSRIQSALSASEAATRASEGDQPAPNEPTNSPQTPAQGHYEPPTAGQHANGP